MIVGQRKPLEELQEMLEGCRNILILGCGTCVSVCMAGGEKEVALLAEQLRMSYNKKGKDVHIDEATIQRQCDREYFEPVKAAIPRYDAVLSTACGVGVQFTALLFPEKAVYPALNTQFMGSNEGNGTWIERCRGCGECVLHLTGGICPVTICAKGLVNGPCGGTDDGKCEVSREKDCAWTLIYRRLEALGRLDDMRRILPPKSYQIQTHPRKMVHEAFIEEETKHA